MKTIHTKEKKQFLKLLHQERIDAAEDRFLIFETFLMTENHVTVAELVMLLADRGFRMDFDFVQGTLQLMVQYGFAKQIQFEKGMVRFEHHHPGMHHDHMVCLKCRKLIEFEDDLIEERQLEIADHHRFHMLLHKLEIYGICADCRQDNTELSPLDHAKPGDRLIIRQYAGGKKLSMKLINMGLRLGDRIEVIANSGNGQVVVAAGFSRYVLGKGIAHKIMVGQAKPH